MICPNSDDDDTALGLLRTTCQRLDKPVEGTKQCVGELPDSY